MSSRLLTTLRTVRSTRPSTSLGRRFNSTNTPQQKAQEAAQKAQEKAQEALVAAQKGLSKAVEAMKKASGGLGEKAGSMLGSQEKTQEALVAAQKRLSKAAEAAKKASGGLGEKAGSMLGSYREPVVYNLQVGRELVKRVYIAERLQPPSWSTVTEVYKTLWQRAISPSYWRELLRSGEYKRVAIYGLEAYGIFKVGEIIGRRHLVGYKLD